MKITIWVMSLTSPSRGKVQESIKIVLGHSAAVRLFSAVPAFSSVKDDSLPDLIIADIAEDPDALTVLIRELRTVRPVDLAVVTSDRSPGMFTRAHQLGAVDYVLEPYSWPRLQDLFRRYQALRFALPAVPQVTQKDIDKLLPAIGDDFSFIDSLDQEILAYLAARPAGAGVEAIASDLMLSPSTTRRMLEALTRKGFLDRVSKSQGDIGRPRVLYMVNIPFERRF